MSQADPFLNILTVNPIEDNNGEHQPIADQFEGKYVWLKCTAGNAGNGSIVNNSLYIILSAGANTRITSVILNSHWKKKSISIEKTSNTIILWQKQPFGNFDLIEFYVRVKAVTPYIVNEENIYSTITGRIAYHTAHNPLLGGALNVSQGNASAENDNATTSLKVLPKPLRK